MSNKINHDPNKVFFTSDPHYWHKNFLTKKFGDRHLDFGEDAEMMNEALIKAWNDKIPKDGLTFVLGDFGFCSAPRLGKILDRLNGKICAIKGNHDKQLNHSKFIWVKDLARVRVGDNSIILGHYPMYTWDGCHKGTWMLCGHEHGNINGDAHMKQWKIMDVGVDTNPDYAPYSYNELKVIMDKRESRPHH